MTNLILLNDKVGRDSNIERESSKAARSPSETGEGTKATYGQNDCLPNRLYTLGLEQINALHISHLF